MPHLFALEAMATRFELVLDAPRLDPSRARAIAEAAMDEIRRVESRWSRFSRDSVLSFVEREAPYRACALDERDVELWSTALEVSRASRGAFDIASSDRDGEGPAYTAIGLEREARRVRFAKSGLRLDFGAVAKGFALDEAAAVLTEHGVERALLHAGTSSVLAIGAPPGRPGWRVALESATGSAWIDLQDGALGVSSQDAQLASRGEPHLFDPANGAAVAAQLVAAVAAPSAALADAWSTALLVLAVRRATLDASALEPAPPDWIVGRGPRNQRRWSERGGDRWRLDAPSFVPSPLSCSA